MESNQRATVIIDASSGVSVAPSHLCLPENKMEHLMSSSLTDLLKKRIFLPFFLTQFLGAFNDNAYKLSMLTLISYHLSHSQLQSEHYQALAGALFILPFFLFSATAGQLADKYDKARMTKWIKFFEVVLMTVGGIGLFKQNIFLMMVTLTGLGIHSSFFGPIKYAILPDHIQSKRLLSATALIEASTFLAILFGTTLGTLIIGNSSMDVTYAVLLTNVIAMLGLFASLFIPPAPAKATQLKVDWHLWRATREMIKGSFLNLKILPTIFTISWFWLIGAVMLTKLPDYTHYVLRANSAVFAFFLALFSVGIALGSITIGRLLEGRITLKYVPLAMLFLSVFAIDLYWVSPIESSELPLQSLTQFLFKFNQIRITIDFFLFSFCAGLFVVPLYTYLQVVSEDSMRARTIATNNIFNALFMVIGSLLVMILLYFKAQITFVFFILAILNGIVALGLWPLLHHHEL